MMAFCPRAAFILLGAFAECACNGSSSSSQPSNDKLGADASSKVVCPGDSGVVTELPSGPCEGDGNCGVEVHQSCGPGIKAIASTPPVYICKCVSSAWSCNEIAGGLSLTPCNDGGTNN